MRFAALSIATALGIGYFPFAPGTIGSLGGLVLWAVLPHTPVVLGVAIVATFAAGAWAGGVAEHHFNGTDPGPVVIDEVMGMLVTLFMNPVGWGGALAGFVIFRAFDVLKPYPANRLEHIPGGTGIMADDFMAAVYSNLVLRAVLAFGLFQ